MVVASTLTLAGAPALAQQEARLAFNIPAQPLASALRAFATQGRQQVLFDEDTLAALRAPRLEGRYTPREALDLLLAGSGVQVTQSSPGFFTLKSFPQLPAQEAQLATVTVTGTADSDTSTEGTGSLAGRYATAGGKTTQRLRDIPKNVSILTSQELADKHITDMSEAMSQISGITVSPDSRIAQMYSRGFTVSNLQIDGGSSQAMSQGYGAGVDGLFGLPNMAAYDHVELLRGADGLFSGNGEPGATVNLARKRPTRERQVLFDLTGGSWNDKRAMLDVGGPLTEDGSIRGRVVGAAQDSDSWFDTVWLRDQFIYGILEADLGPRTLLTVGGSYDNQDGSGYERTQTWRAGSKNGQLMYSPRNTWNLPWSNYHQVTRQVFTKLEHAFDAGWKLGANVTWQDQSGHDLYARHTWFDSDTRLGDLVAWEARTFNRQLMGDLNLSGSVDLFGRKHDVLVGADYRQSRGYWRSRYPDDTLASVDAPTPRPTAAELATWSGSDFDAAVPSANKRTGYYANLRLNLSDPLKLIIGGRYSQNTTSDGARSIGKFLPSAGLTFDFHRDWTAFASVADIYQPLYKKVPVGQYNADISKITFKDDPTTGRNYELGVKGDLHNGALQVTSSLFYIDKRNVWVNDTAQGEVTIPGYGKTYMMRPAADVISKGLDTEVKGQLARGWQLSAGYTYNLTKDNGNGGKPLLEFAPLHTAKIWTTYELPGELSAWRIGGGVRGFSKSSFQGGYSLADISAGYRIDQHLNLDLIVKNAADKLYRAGTWDGPVYGVGRSLTLTLSGKY